MSSVQSLFSCQSSLATNLHCFAAMCVLLSQLWEVNMELRGEPISGDIFTPGLLFGYHRLKPQVNSLDIHLKVNLVNINKNHCLNIQD